MEKEIWKDIDGYEGLYQVSNLGRVKSLHHNKEKILKGSYNSKGYYFVKLCKNGISKSIFVHRLVAQEFIPNPDNLPIVNHKDENPRNNNVDNLEWCTQKYNANYGTVRERQAQTYFNNRNNHKPTRYNSVLSPLERAKRMFS